MGTRLLRVAKLVALALVVLIALSGCVQGSGNVVTEERQVGEIEKVELSGIGRLEITQGDSTSLTVEADDNLMQYIKTETVNDTLEISLRSKVLPFLPVDPSGTIVYRLTVPSLSRVSLSGSGEIASSGFEADELEIDISGSGKLELTELVVERFVYDLSGSGRAVLSGTAQQQEVTISGSGRLEAEELRCADASIEINGSGRAIVWVTEQLRVDISGSGDVQYYGSPDVDQDVSGSGSIKGLGEKN
jgi:hypothetical protein